jgi:hypothetical protein
MLVFGTQVRVFKPGRSRRIFNVEKFLSAPSFVGEVKTSFPYRRFAACKKSPNVTRKSTFSTKLPENSRPHISNFRRWVLSPVSESENI